MLCIKFEYLTDKMIKHVSDLLIKEDGFGDVCNPKDIFIHATSPNETLKTAVTAEWFERNKVELGYNFIALNKMLKSSVLYNCNTIQKLVLIESIKTI